MYELNFVLYCSAEDQVLAEQWQQRLTQLGVATEMCIVEQINARFLRQHPDLALLVDAQGLWLAANGMKMQPAWHEELPRLKRASIKNELIARACNMAKSERILDATAGLGHDGLLLAWLGANVTLIERHPVLFALLESSLEQAKQHPILADTAQRIQLLHTDAEQYLSASADKQLVNEQRVNEQTFDVIYLDPMFPQRDASQKQEKKQAKVKKQMQLLHLLLPVDGIMDLGENLLHLAQQQTKRVVVKRPKYAVFLADLAPQHQWQGDACRFDAYFQ